VGKGNIPSMKIFLLAAAMAVLAACHHELADPLQSGQILSLGSLSGRWVGPVTPGAEGCGPKATGLMSIEGGQFAFDPFQGATVIKGTVSDDGQFAGTLARAIGQQTATISFSGTVSRGGNEDEIAGRLVSGRCTWAVTLKRG
jgi:hypothetical protein